MISYELAKKLKDEGFPQKGDKDYPVFWFMPSGQVFLDSKEEAQDDYVYIPTTFELIEACNGDSVVQLIVGKAKHTAMHWKSGLTSDSHESIDDALGDLWIALRPDKGVE